MSERDQRALESFQHALTLMCARYGTELNGCFSISIAGREGPDCESDTDVVRNIEHVSESGVIRTVSRGNRP